MTLLQQMASRGKPSTWPGLCFPSWSQPPRRSAEPPLCLELPAPTSRLPTPQGVASHILTNPFPDAPEPTSARPDILTAHSPSYALHGPTSAALLITRSLRAPCLSPKPTVVSAGPRVLRVALPLSLSKATSVSRSVPLHRPPWPLSNSSRHSHAPPSLPVYQPCPSLSPQIPVACRVYLRLCILEQNKPSTPRQERERCLFVWMKAGYLQTPPAHRLRKKPRASSSSYYYHHLSCSFTSGSLTEVPGEQF